MERLGLDLKILMKRFGGKFPMHLVIDIGMQLTMLFKEIHKLGYCYRDLCPK